MSIDVRVSVEEMRAHADRLHDVANDGRTGVEAARTVSCHGDAFGLLCSFIGAKISPVEGVGVATAATAVTGIDATAEAIRGLATLFERADAAVDELFDLFKGDGG